MTSMTPCLSAALAERLAAPRTACSAHSALRPRNSASPRMQATASLTTLRSIAEPGGVDSLGESAGAAFGSPGFFSGLVPPLELPEEELVEEELEPLPESCGV